jgi:ParB-like chromosome segregation protein Spo0J
MEIALREITIGPRFRQDLGDIAGLAASIQRLGLLHPIIVSTDHELIVGRRRLAAHEHLGLETIEAWVVDLDDPMNAEIDENTQRKDYTISEWIAIGEAREERDYAPHLPGWRLSSASVKELGLAVGVDPPAHAPEAQPGDSLPVQRAFHRLARCLRELSEQRVAPMRNRRVIQRVRLPVLVLSDDLRGIGGGIAAQDLDA